MTAEDVLAGTKASIEAVAKSKREMDPDPALDDAVVTEWIRAETAFVDTAHSAMPRLVTAVEAVLYVHRPYDNADDVCRNCTERIPCPTVRAITTALEAK